MAHLREAEVVPPMNHPLVAPDRPEVTATTELLDEEKKTSTRTFLSQQTLPPRSKTP